MSASCPGASFPRSSGKQRAAICAFLFSSMSQASTKATRGSASVLRWSRWAVRADEIMCEVMPSVPRPSRMPFCSSASMFCTPTALFMLDSGLWAIIVPVWAMRSISDSSRCTPWMKRDFLRR